MRTDAIGHRSMNRLEKIGYRPTTDCTVDSFMCSLDFVRALNERPWIVKVLCRLFFGKWAYSEFNLMIRSMDGYQQFYSYGLRDACYHKDEKLRWWLHE